MSIGTTAAPGKRRHKGARPKHVPQRMCIACHDRTSKRTLTRIVRTPEGIVVIDSTGKRNGRGAYVHDIRSCWEQALSSNSLANALKTEIDEDSAAMLRAYAAGLPQIETELTEPTAVGKGNATDE
jgi:predicted RNA-binding protein YlxR (DUF448 family)